MGDTGQGYVMLDRLQDHHCRLFDICKVLDAHGCTNPAVATGERVKLDLPWIDQSSQLGGGIDAAARYSPLTIGFIFH